MTAQMIGLALPLLAILAALLALAGARAESPPRPVAETVAIVRVVDESPLRTLGRVIPLRTEPLAPELMARLMEAER